MISPKPCQAQHWAKDDLHEAPFYPRYMPRDRYDQISTCLHFADDSYSAENRLWKLSPIIEHLLNIYVPTQTITVDESLWKFRGRLRFVTYNPTKGARFGLNVYKLSVSTSPMCGYISAFRFYTGQDTGKVPASHKVVSYLMIAADVLDKGYNLFVDNWYSSPTLFLWLQGRKANACGTVRGNRKGVPVIFPRNSD